MQPSDSRSKGQKPQAEFAFGAANYKLLLIGIGVLILGYALMVGGGSEDPAEFSDDVFDFRRITLAPIVVLIGYGAVFYAILKKPSAKEE